MWKSFLQTLWVCVKVYMCMWRHECSIWLLFVSMCESVHMYVTAWMLYMIIVWACVKVYMCMWWLECSIWLLCVSMCESVHVSVMAWMLYMIIVCEHVWKCTCVCDRMNALYDYCVWACVKVYMCMWQNECSTWLIVSMCDRVHVFVTAWMLCMIIVCEYVWKCTCVCDGMNALYDYCLWACVKVYMCMWWHECSIWLIVSMCESVHVYVTAWMLFMIIVCEHVWKCTCVCDGMNALMIIVCEHVWKCTCVCDGMNALMIIVCEHVWKCTCVWRIEFSIWLFCSSKVIARKAQVYLKS